LEIEINMLSSFQSFKQLLTYAKPWRFKIYLATIYSVLNKLFDIAPEILIGVAVDLVVNKQDSWISQLGFNTIESQLIFLAVTTFFIWVFESLFQYLYSVKWRNIAQEIEHAIRLDGYSHVQSLDVDWHENQRTGNLTAILNDDVNQLERFLNDGANEIIQIIISSISIGFIFFYVSPLLGIVAILPIPLILLIAMFFQKNLSPRYRNVRDSAGLLSATIFNNLLGIQTIKSFIQELRESLRVKELSKYYQRQNLKAIVMSSAFVPVVRMGVLSGFLGTMVIGSKMALTGDLDVGSFSVLVFLTQRFLWPFTDIAIIIDNFERSMASTKRILELLNIRPKINNPKSEVINANYKSDIKFSNIDFYYNKSNPVFTKLNFVIEGSKFTGIVGHTGSGKTTLAKLLLRFYDPINGTLKINNIDIKQLSIQKLRKHIGFVSQDTFLFDGTIKDNIAYHDSSISLENIILAAKKSQAHSFIQELSDGYDTLVGERGQKLSGGQKQRLAIARAILKNPDILIFDEATSSVDNETEQLIQIALNEIAKDRTTIVIAHRLSTIRNAHNIIVLSNSKIIEQGRHDELIKNESGYYSSLWKIQTGQTNP